MKSSKKLMTRVLTAALALSMVAGTSVCAFAVEDTEFDGEPLVIAAPDDGEDIQVELSKLEVLKQKIEAAAQKVYSKLSQTTAAKLAEIVQKVKASQQIMTDAYSKVSEIKTNIAEQAVAIREAAQQMVVALEDEEQIAQIMAEAEQQIEQLVQEAEAQINEIMASAEEVSQQLLAEATAQFNEIKLQIMSKATQVYMNIQQAIGNVREEIAKLKEQIQELSVGLLQEILNRTTKTENVSDEKFDYTIYKTLTGTYAVVAGYKGEDEEVVIPAYINDIPVRNIMFFSETVKSVTLPETIKDITGIPVAMLFALEEINVSEDNPYFKSVDGVLYDKSGKKVVAVPLNKEYTIPEGVTAIGEAAFFAHTEMTKIDIPYTVRLIGANAFENCWGLEEIEIPSGVEKIGDRAFLNCKNLKKAVMPSTVEKIYDDAFADVAEDFAFYCDDVCCYAYEYAKQNGIKVVAPLSVGLMIDFNTAPFDDFTLPVGGSIKLSADNVGGGSGEGYTFAFYYKKPGSDKWTTKQGFKDNASVDFVAEFEGTYKFCVKVKDSEGKIAKVYGDLTFRNGFENTSTISEDTIKKGKTVTVNCAASVDPDQVQYAVYYKKTTDKKWVTKQDYGENAEVTIKPAKAADYIICVKAKNINDGTISKKYFNVKVEA